MYPGQSSDDEPKAYTAPGYGRVQEEYALPPGTLLAMSPFFVLRNEGAFTNLLVFDAERWVGGTEEERRQLDKYWVPFS